MQSKTGGGDSNSTVHDRLNNLNIQKVLRNQRKIYALTKKLYIGYKSQNKNYK